MGMTVHQEALLRVLLTRQIVMGVNVVSLLAPCHASAWCCRGRCPLGSGASCAAREMWTGCRVAGHGWCHPRCAAGPAPGGAGHGDPAPGRGALGCGRDIRGRRRRPV